MPPKGSKKAEAPAHTYAIGTTVLGRVKGYPPWPAKIVDPEKEYLSKAVLALKPAKLQTHLVRFYDDGNYAWQPSKELKPLSERDIDDFLNDAKKKTGALHNAYKTAKDPAEWEEAHLSNMVSQRKRDEERAAGVDELESETEAVGGDSKKRKRKEPAKKSAGKKAKKPAHSEDELAEKPAKKVKASAEEESAPGFRKCKEWRRELQKGFLSNGKPSDEDMPKFDQIFKDIEAYHDKTEYLELNKLPKVIKRIANLDGIARDADFHIKARAGQIIEQWTKLFARPASATTASGPAPSASQPAKAEPEDLKPAAASTGNAFASANGPTSAAGGAASDATPDVSAPSATMDVDEPVVAESKPATVTSLVDDTKPAALPPAASAPTSSTTPVPPPIAAVSESAAPAPPSSAMAPGMPVPPTEPMLPFEPSTPLDPITSLDSIAPPIPAVPTEKIEPPPAQSVPPQTESASTTLLNGMGEAVDAHGQSGPPQTIA